MGLGLRIWISVFGSQDLDHWVSVSGFGSLCLGISFGSMCLGLSI